MERKLDITDDDLIRRTLKGETKAYESLVLRYQKLVFNVVFQIVKNQETSADLAQDTFLKAYQALPTFRSGAAFRPWLLRIATNRALNSVRDSKPLSSLDELLTEAPAMEPVSSQSVEAEVESRLNQQQLNRVLEGLTPQHRNLFLLRYQHDLSYEEISEVLGQPVSTIKSLLFRVRSKVRMELDKIDARPTT